ncbi:Nucleotidyltransferase domain protein [uncultured archaeon]|nr:Nucleotidyltransferase domain protein [uncultured archaeon]
MVRKEFGELEGFIKRVKAKYRDSKIILFGSRARGEHLEDSDYDFIIISQKFTGIGFADRIEQIQSLWTRHADVEPLCYTPEEFNEKKGEIGIVKEAARQGIVLA